MSNIFMPLVGQYDNIGDIVLRRELVDWVRETGMTLHTYVGDAPSGYVEGLTLPSGSVTYSSVRNWIGEGVRSSRRGFTKGYFFKPGEIQLTGPGLKEHVGLFPAVRLIESCGVPVFRVGAGARRGAGSAATLSMRATINQRQVTYWRDPWTRDLLGGGLMPDLAFGQVLDHNGNSETRDILIVSIRSDRPALGPEWCQQVKTAAQQLGLRVVVVSQVERDNERGKELAQALQGDFEPWDGQAHLAHERRLREIYSRAQVTLSDRLHALIVAFTEGSVPCFAFPSTPEKAARHFHDVDTNAYEFVDTSGHTDATLLAIRSAAAKSSKVDAAADGVRQSLRQPRDHVVSLIGA